MANKFNNRTLLIVLVALAALYFLSNFLQSRSRTKTSLNTELVTIDTSAITEFTVDNENPVKFTRNGNQWQVTSNGITDEADINSVNTLLSQLLTIKAERLVANSSDKWGEYQLTDSTATRVTVIEGGKGETLDLYVGRFQYRPPAQTQQNQFQQQQPQIQGSTYVRVGGDEKVYATEGFLAMTFSGGFKTWREGQFLRATKSNIRQVQFDYPADSSFVLARPDSLWTLNGEIIENQNSVDTYLNNLVYKQDKNFTDNFSGVGVPTHSLTISGDNMTNIVVKAFADHTNDYYYLQSTLNPGATVESKKGGLFGQLFVDKSKFLE